MTTAAEAYSQPWHWMKHRRKHLDYNVSSSFSQLTQAQQQQPVRDSNKSTPETTPEGHLWSGGL